jgi:predicted DNA-binding protein YlxM (UPF0122 family)
MVRKVVYIHLDRKVEDPREFIIGKKCAFKTPYGKVSLAELAYTAIEALSEDFEYIPQSFFFVSLEVLLKKELTLPRDTLFNRFSTTLNHIIRSLKDQRIISTITSSASPSLLSFYTFLGKTTHELAKNFRDFGKRLGELEKELFVDVNYIRKIYPLHDNLKNLQTLPSNKNIDELEKIIGRKIVERERILPYDNALRSACEKILERWQENEKLYHFVKEKNIEIPKTIKAKIDAPRNVLLNAKFPVHFIILSLIYPRTFEEIQKETGYKSPIIKTSLSILCSYGIISTHKERGTTKYLLVSSHPYKIAHLKTSMLMKRYENYREAINMSHNSLNLSEIAKKLNISRSTLYGWIKEGKKPYTINQNIANLLVKVGVTNEEKIKEFEKYGLVRNV